MPLARLTLILLLASTPILLAIQAFACDVIALAAVLLGICVIGYSATGHPASDRPLPNLNGVLALSTLPALWIIFQLMPMPVDSLAHPIWRSVGTAFGHDISGHISVDLGGSFGALVRYLVLVLVLFSTAIVASNRREAPRLTIALSCAAAIAALETLLASLTLSESSFQTIVRPRSDFVALANLGLLSAVAAAWSSAGQFRRKRKPLMTASFALAVSLPLGVIFICAAAALQLGNVSLLAPAILGLAAMSTLGMIRCTVSRSWPGAVALMVSSVAAITIVIGAYGSTDHSGSPASTNPPDAAYAIARRATMDLGLLGAGSGSFASLAHIYGDVGDLPSPGAPSTLIAAQLEWGSAGTTAGLLFSVLLFGLLGTAAVRRGRDACFPALAAAVILTQLYESAQDAGGTSAVVQLFVTIVIAIGFGQSVGETGKRKA